MAIEASAAETVNHWLAAIPHDGAPLRLDDNGQCGLTDDAGNSCLVYVPDVGHDVVLYTDIAQVKLQQSARFYEEILAMNTMGQYTRGAMLSFDRLERSLVLQAVFPVETLGEITFMNAVENFFVVTQEVTQRVREIVAADIEVPTQTVPADRPMAVASLDMLRA